MKQKQTLNIYTKSSHYITILISHCLPLLLVPHDPSLLHLHHGPQLLLVPVLGHALLSLPRPWTGV